MMPVRTPPPATAAASTANSPIGMPNISALLRPATSGGSRFSPCDGAADEIERVAKHLGTGARLDGRDRKVAAECTGAGYLMEQSHQMTKNGTRPHTGGGLA